jgi:DNA invertase Pin-like site-specific DNA recombinase
LGRRAVEQKGSYKMIKTSRFGILERDFRTALPVQATSIMLTLAMNYGYIRVSTDKQTVENQRFEITRFCEHENIAIDHWIEETISGAKDPEKRKLGKVLSKLQKGDILVCAELSRLGRSLLMIMEILNRCLKREVQVWTIKDNYRLGVDISSKVLAFAFGLTAEIERNLVSQRTKEALIRKRFEGIILGRPKGRRSARVKLTGREDEVLRLLQRGHSKSRIARRLKVHRITLDKFMRERLHHIHATTHS